MSAAVQQSKKAKSPGGVAIRRYWWSCLELWTSWNSKMDMRCQTDICMQF